MNEIFVQKYYKKIVHINSDAAAIKKNKMYLKVEKIICCFTPVKKISLRIILWRLFVSPPMIIKKI